MNYIDLGLKLDKMDEFLQCSDPLEFKFREYSELHDDILSSDLDTVQTYNLKDHNRLTYRMLQASERSVRSTNVERQRSVNSYSRLFKKEYKI